MTINFFLRPVQIMKAVTALLFTCLSIQVSASDVVDLTKEEEILLVNSYLDILEDTSNALDIKDILSPAFQNKFQTNTKKYPYTINENLNATYWLRIKMKGYPSASRTVMAQFNNPTLSYVDLYYTEPSGKIIHRQSGDLVPFINRAYRDRRIVFEIPLNDDSTTVYFKIKSNSYSGFSTSLISFKNFNDLTRIHYYLQGIYLGIVVIMMLYNLMTAIALKETIYLYFCLYALSCALYTLDYTRIGVELLWPDDTLYNHHVSFFASSLLVISFTLYAVRIIDLKKYYPRIITPVLTFSGVILLFNFIQEYIYEFISFSDVSFYLPFIPLYILAFMVLRKGHKPALFFFSGLSFLIAVLIMAFLERIDILWPTDFSEFSFQLAFIAEILTFAFALSVRMRIIKEERALALEEKNSAQQILIEQYKQNEWLKEKVNRELEDKVQQRTQELKEKNAETIKLYETIRQQADELGKWNVKLDLDNRKLSNDIKEIIASRVLNKTVELEDFNKIFPDDLSCYRFLEELKWGNGYSCIECGCEKYSEGKVLFARRCTRCGYEESVIYNTIFQGSKISLSKQFYMLFLIYHAKGEITSNQLAETLDMRMKTCWAFSKKVKDHMGKRKWAEIDGWDSLILL